MKQVSRLNTVDRATRVLGAAAVSAAVSAIGLFGIAESANAAQFDLGPADDNTRSLGNFRIWVAPEFRPLVNGFPGYDPGTFRLTSPTLFDPNTIIGRSNVHIDGSATDIGGTPVGTAGTIVADGNFAEVPAGFEGPNGTREVHTEVRSLEMTGGGAAVRAGTAFGLPLSPGEVESQSGNSGDPDLDFPADSFFNIFAEVDIPNLGGLATATLFNTDPLMITSHEPLNAFPPRVVYIHGGTEAVNVFFRDNNAPFWNANDRFGRLVLAGHGIGFDNIQDDIDDFDDIIEQQDEMPVPEESAPEPTTTLGSVMALGFGAFLRRKTSQKGKGNKKS